MWILKWPEANGRPYFSGTAERPEWKKRQKKARRFTSAAEAQAIADTWQIGMKPRVVRLGRPASERIARAFATWDAVPRAEREVFLAQLAIDRGDLDGDDFTPEEKERREATYDAAIALLSAGRS